MTFLERRLIEYTDMVAMAYRCQLTSDPEGYSVLDKMELFVQTIPTEIQYAIFDNPASKDVPEGTADIIDITMNTSQGIPHCSANTGLVKAAYEHFVRDWLIKSPDRIASKYIIDFPGEDNEENVNIYSFTQTGIIGYDRSQWDSSEEGFFGGGFIYSDEYWRYPQLIAYLLKGEDVYQVAEGKGDIIQLRYMAQQHEVKEITFIRVVRFKQKEDKEGEETVSEEGSPEETDVPEELPEETEIDSSLLE